jgi:hypothetical protein
MEQQVEKKPLIDSNQEKALKEMFNLTESVISTVLQNEKGFDDAIDTLLNMTSDPLHQPIYHPQPSPGLSTSAPVAQSPKLSQPAKLHPLTNGTDVKPTLNCTDQSPTATRRLHDQLPVLIEKVNIKECSTDLLQTVELNTAIELSPALPAISSDLEKLQETTLGDPQLLPQPEQWEPLQITEDKTGSTPNTPTNGGMVKTLDFQEIVGFQEGLEKRSPLPSFAGEPRKLSCPTSARVDDTVAVTWDLGPLSDADPDDWIGLFKQNQPSNSNYVSYQKTNGARSGSLTFTVPALGSWEFRFFPRNSYEYTLRSNLLVVGCNVQLIALLDPSNSQIKLTLRLIHGHIDANDWIGLYKASTYHNKEYIAHKYVGEEGNRVFYFDAPRQPGQYQLRYFPANSSYNDVARSNLITIEDRDMVLATPSMLDVNSREKISVSWRISSTETTKWDWVGLYEVGTDTYLEYRYVEPGKNSTTFACPTKPGTYEARYCLAATSSLLSTGQTKASNKITVRSSPIGTTL